MSIKIIEHFLGDAYSSNAIIVNYIETRGWYDPIDVDKFDLKVDTAVHLPLLVFINGTVEYSKAAREILVSHQSGKRIIRMLTLMINDITEKENSQNELSEEFKGYIVDLYQTMLTAFTTHTDSFSEAGPESLFVKLLSACYDSGPNAGFDPAEDEELQGTLIKIFSKRIEARLENQSSRFILTKPVLEQILQFL